jgi:2-polyprenyl-6-methoxyphenol hydroxylase-like FAD-dependent oxidoreductase
MPTWLDDGKPREAGASGLAELKEIAESLAEPWKSAIKWIPDDPDITHNKISYWVTSPWDNRHGTVTLAGDAAHPLPPRTSPELSPPSCNPYLPCDRCFLHLSSITAR